MYSDLWMKNPDLCKSMPVHITNGISIAYWRDLQNNVIGITINFEMGDDIHFELAVDDWKVFVKSVLPNAETENELDQFKGFIHTALPHVKFEAALEDNNIKYQKVAFFDCDFD